VLVMLLAFFVLADYHRIGALSRILMRTPDASSSAAAPALPPPAAGGAGAATVGGPYACVNCQQIPPDLLGLCRNLTLASGPCFPYGLVHKKLCERTCIAVHRKPCKQQFEICRSDPDCSVLCKSFFTELCPEATTDEQEVAVALEQRCLGVPLSPLVRDTTTVRADDHSTSFLEHASTTTYDHRHSALLPLR